MVSPTTTGSASSPTSPLSKTEYYAGADNAPEQRALLDTALFNVHANAHHMKRRLDDNDLLAALKHASTMLAELRTPSLPPKLYYELYMAVFDSLRHLSAFLHSAQASGEQSLSDVYELVQYAGNIVPRLYLLVAVGAACMRVASVASSGIDIDAVATPTPSDFIAVDASNLTSATTTTIDTTTDATTSNTPVDTPPVKDLMNDMLEMTRGVQHPVRGLFLRYFLTSLTRDYLPTSLVDSPHGTLHDSIHFILTNFIEMNKLWVRLQFQGHSRDREKRETERKELRLLIGSNLVRLSQLEINLDIYKSLVLPSILEECISCRDTLAQEYLLEVIIQVFPDEYHLRTLDALLGATAQLQRAANVKSIVVSLVDRFAKYMKRSRDDGAQIPTNLKLFEVFWLQIVQLVEARPEFSITDIIALLLSLMNLSLSTYPDRIDYIDKILGFAAQRVYEAAEARAYESSQFFSGLRY